MKLIKCIVRTYKADETMDALKEIDLSGFTVTEVGGQRPGGEPKDLSWGGRQLELRYVPKTMIDVLVADHVVDRRCSGRDGQGPHRQEG